MVFELLISIFRLPPTSNVRVVLRLKLQRLFKSVAPGS